MNKAEKKQKYCNLFEKALKTVNFKKACVETSKSLFDEYLVRDFYVSEKLMRILNFTVKNTPEYKAVYGTEITFEFQQFTDDLIINYMCDQLEENNLMSNSGLLYAMRKKGYIE